MSEKFCKSCVHYHQHYALDQRKIFRVYCGHCAYSRPKTRRPDAAGCEHYIQTAPDEAAFVTKEYLSKALLDYMMKLECLPEIRELEK